VLVAVSGGQSVVLRVGDHLAGGRIIAQDEATSVVWGMPGAVAAAGHAEAVKPLKDLGALALRMLNGEAA
jgi:two-component system chemotaxis response regulator CheB